MKITIISKFWICFILFLTISFNFSQEAILKYIYETKVDLINPQKIISQAKNLDYQKKHRFVEHLINFSSSKNEKLRRRMVFALSALKMEGKIIIPFLNKAIKDVDTGVKTIAITSLRNFSSEAGSSVPFLIQSLNDRSITNIRFFNNEIRTHAAITLGMLGKQSKKAIPNLLRNLNAKNKEFSIHCAIALVRVGYIQKSLLPNLINGIQMQENYYIRTLALESLEKFGAKAKRIIPDLIKNIKSQDDLLKIKTMKIFKNMGVEAKETIPLIISIIETTNKNFGNFLLYNEALSALSKIGYKLKEVLIFITIQSLNSTENIQKIEEKLYELLPKEKILSLLNEALKSKNRLVNLNAKTLIYRIKK